MLSDFRPPPAPRRVWWQSPRWIGAALVAAVHAVAVVFLVTSITSGPLNLPAPREIFFLFHPPPPPHRPPPPRTVFIPPTQPAAPVFRAIAPLPPDVPTDAKGLALSLFGCTPENLADLTPEQRMHCSGTPVMTSFGSSFDTPLQEHALQATRWRAAVAERNTPLSVPCITVSKDDLPGSSAGPGRSGNRIMIDPLCQLLQTVDSP
ncbi:MAG TPA: hypothetical protein VHZ78_09435 [Rhizomicrobium sp.]|nr:hypothetical protein [Rhizomicrobium sp.]